MDVYHFIRFVVTGYKDGPKLGEICEIIGKAEVI